MATKRQLRRARAYIYQHLGVDGRRVQRTQPIAAFGATVDELDEALRGPIAGPPGFKLKRRVREIGSDKTHSLTLQDVLDNITDERDAAFRLPLGAVVAVTIAGVCVGATAVLYVAGTL